MNTPLVSTRLRLPGPVCHPLPADPRKQLYALWEHTALEAKTILGHLARGAIERRQAFDRIDLMVTGTATAYSQQVNALNALGLEPLPEDQADRWEAARVHWLHTATAAAKFAERVDTGRMTAGEAEAEVEKLCAIARAASRVAYKREMSTLLPSQAAPLTSTTWTDAAREWEALAANVLNWLYHLNAGGLSRFAAASLVEAGERRAHATEDLAAICAGQLEVPQADGVEQERETSDEWNAVAKAAAARVKDIGAGGALYLLMAIDTTTSEIAACRASHPLPPPT